MTPGFIESLRNDGVAAKLGEDLDEVCAATFDHMASHPPRNEGTSKGEYLRAYPLLGTTHPVVVFAEDEAVIAPLAEYLGYCPRLRYATVFHYLLCANPAIGHQMFHRDPGAVERYGRIVVYLNDVDMDGGPFCYVPGTQPLGRYADIEPKKSENFSSLGEMRAVLPHWEFFPGPKYTMIYADTKGFHKGMKPITRDRVALILGYH
jgi:hypothetical protein